MTSNINPNNIDGAYPVAGQDNNSQGFRDNFTNTATNFQYAAEEISDLQAKAVLKSALVGTELNNNMGGSVLSNAQLQDMSEAIVSLGSVSGSTPINYALGSYQTLTTNGAVTLAFTNFPAVNDGAGTVRVVVGVASTAHTLVFPAAVSVNARGIQGFNAGTNTISFSSIGTFTFEFTTSNGGTTVLVTEVNKQIQPFNNSSEDLVSSGAANLAVTTSYFSTSAAETATLAAGVAGQIKIFSALDVSSGDMVITVTNAGWQPTGTGTITFNSRGQSCILQYTNNKWFCIGNNGCTFG